MSHQCRAREQNPPFTDKQLLAVCKPFVAKLITCQLAVIDAKENINNKLCTWCKTALYFLKTETRVQMQERLRLNAK